MMGGTSEAQETAYVKVQRPSSGSVRGGGWGVEGDKAGIVSRCHQEGLPREMWREGRKGSWGNKMLLGSAWGNEVEEENFKAKRPRLSSTFRACVAFLLHKVLIAHNTPSPLFHRNTFLAGYRAIQLKTTFPRLPCS